MISARHERGIACALLALLAARAVWGALADASVADEHPHILAGWLYAHSGRFGGGFDNPPLGQLWIAWPLRLLRLPYAFAADTFLVACRLPVIALLLGLGVLMWRWGRTLAGPAAGLAALAGLALEPNLVAHGHLATLDAPVTALWWASLWAWRGALERAAAAPDGGRRWLWSAPVLLFALCAAAAAWTKFTALLLYPIAAAVALAVPGVPRRRALLAVGLALVVAWAAAWVAYGFAPFDRGLPQPLTAGLLGKWQHRDEVRFAYLAGRQSEHGFLAYYLVALLVKTPLPLFAAAAWGATRRLSRLDRALLALPAAALLIAFSVIRVDLGVRQVLPVLPALVLLAAVGLVDGLRRGGWWRVGAVVLAAAWIVGVARQAPRDLAYFNALAGGAHGGHRVLLDSNLSWGQDDERLQRFLAAARARGEIWHVLPDSRTPRTGRIAVESNALHNLNRTSRRPYEWLRRLPAAGFAGDSWRLYVLDREDYARAARRYPRDVAVQAAWASILEHELAMAAADSVWRAAAAIDPAGIASRAARVALQAGDWQRASMWLRTAPRDPEIESLAERARLERARATADSGAAPAAALALGTWYGERDELDRALPHLEWAAAARPADGEAQRALAVALARLGRWAEAAARLARPDLRQAFARERQLCLALAVADSAVAAWGERPFTPGAVGAVDAELRFELGRAHFEAERFAPAARAFASIVADDPSARWALAYLGEMQVRCKLRIADQVLPALRIDPRRPRSTAFGNAQSPY